MSLGHHGKLFLPRLRPSGQPRAGHVRHRGSPAHPGRPEQLRDAKSLVWEGFRAALSHGAPAPAAAGVLVDEATSTPAARAARAAGIRWRWRSRRRAGTPSSSSTATISAHLEAFDTTLGKALVRWNPADDLATKMVQAERLLRLGARLQQQGRKLLFELIVPPTPHQLALAGDRLAGFDAHLRPGLMLESIYEIQEAGIEPDVWKIEGLDGAADCALVSALIRRDGRDGVKAVVLGHGADDARVEHWVRTAAAVPGYAGFAIGRTIWWDAVQDWKEGRLDPHRGGRRHRRRLPAVHRHVRGPLEEEHVAHRHPDRGRRRPGLNSAIKQVVSRAPARASPSSASAAAGAG